VNARRTLREWRGPRAAGVLAGSGYTRRVSWKRPVSIVVLTILTALPASAALCPMLCAYDAADASMASGHQHGSTTTATDPSNDSRIDGVSDDGCGHDGALLHASTTAAERADRGVVSVPAVTTGVPVASALLAESGPYVEYRAPGTAPPTETTLVLRV